jgi:hypothetical protein
MFLSRLSRTNVLQRALYTTESLSAGEKLIHQKLTEALDPHKLRVVDVSGKFI